MKVFIENERGSTTKHIFNEKTCEFIKSTEVSAPYPFPYGFILGTTSGDGDNVDCFVLTYKLLKTRDVLEAEPIALLEMHEDNEVDHKVIAVLPSDPIALDTKTKQSITHFLDTVFSHIPGKQMRVGEFRDAEAAQAFIRDTLDIDE